MSLKVLKVHGHMEVFERPSKGLGGQVREELRYFLSLVVAQKGGVLDCGAERVRKLKNGPPGSLADHIQNGAHYSAPSTATELSEHLDSPARSSRHVTSPLAITVQTCSDTQVIRLGVRRRAPRICHRTWPDSYGLVPS